MNKRFWFVTITLVVISIGLSGALLVNSQEHQNWRTASREPAGIAPPAATTRDAVLHVYGARAWSWRGWFAIHTWIAAKPRGASTYTVYEVRGWREKRGLPVLRIANDHPDRYWFGEKPQLLVGYQGPQANRLIPQVEAAVQRYPWKNRYRVFPGPNSNSFTAWIAEQVPELKLKLPWTAIGQGYVKLNRILPNLVQ
jgi:hypothetical protein